MSPTWGAHCPSPPLPPHKRLSVPILYQNQNQTSPQKAGTALILTAHGGEGPLRGESASLWEAWQARALSGSARPQHRPPSSPTRGGEPIAREDPPSFLAPQGRGAHRPGEPEACCSFSRVLSSACCENRTHVLGEIGSAVVGGPGLSRGKSSLHPEDAGCTSGGAHQLERSLQGAAVAEPLSCVLGCGTDSWW